MKTSSSLLVTCLFSLVMICPALHAGDSSGVVLLSPRFGPRIDALDAKRYGLFQQFAGFQNVTLFRAPAQFYYARFHYVTSDGLTRDTVVQYSEALLLMLAEKVDHYEDIVDGTYHFGDSPSKLVIIPGIDSSGATLPSPPPTVKSVSKPTEIEQKYPLPASDILPLAVDPEVREKLWYPNLGFGVGITTLSVDLSGLNNAVAAVENKYKLQGYEIVTRSPEVDFGSLVWVHLKVRISYPIAFLVEAGSSTSGETSTFHVVTASVLYHFKPLETSWFRPYIGVGIAAYRFSFDLQYGMRISPVTDYGSFTTLDKIQVMGGRTAPLLRGGLEVGSPGVVGLEAYVLYAFIPAIETNTMEGVPASVRLGGFIAGARMTLTL